MRSNLFVILLIALLAIPYVISFNNIPSIPSLITSTTTSTTSHDNGNPFYSLKHDSNSYRYRLNALKLSIIDEIPSISESIESIVELRTKDRSANPRLISR